MGTKEDFEQARIETKALRDQLSVAEQRYHAAALAHLQVVAPEGTQFMAAPQTWSPSSFWEIQYERGGWQCIPLKKDGSRAWNRSIALLAAEIILAAVEP